MGSPYPGYGNYGSLVPSGPFGQVGQVLGGLGASAGQWLPLIGQMMQGQEETAWKGLQIALQSPNEQVRRQAIEDYEKRRKSPFHVPWPTVPVPGQTQAVPRDPFDRSTATPPAPQDVNAPGGGLAAPVTAQGPGPTPTTATMQLPGTQQYWVPPVDVAQRSYQDVLGSNPAPASAMFLAQLQQQGIPVNVPIGQVLANPVWAAQVESIAKTLVGWGPMMPGQTPVPGAPAPQPPGGPTVPGASPSAGPPAGSAGPPAPGPAPSVPQVTAPPGQPASPQGTVPPRPPTAEAPRINPAIVASAQGKNAFTMTAAEALEAPPSGAGGFPLTAAEEAEWSAIPARNYGDEAALQAAALDRRAKRAAIASETATAGLRGAETGRIEQETASARVKSKQEFYRGKAFGILFDNLPDAATRIAQMRQQVIDEKVPGLEPESVMGQAREMVNTARTGQAIPVSLKGPDGKPISVYMTGAEYRRMQQEDERLALTRGAERVNQIKRQILEPVIKQYGYDTSKWPDDARVLIGIEPKPTSPLAILQMATRLAQSDLRFTAAPDQASRNAIIHEYIDTIRAGLEEVKPTKPGPGPTTPNAAGAKPPSGPLDPKVAALVKELKGPQAPALQAAGALGAWLQRTFAEIPPVGTPEDAVILMQLERAWPGLTPAQRTQLATALPIQPAMVAWLDRHVQTPGGPPGPGAPPAASPGARGPQPGQPTKPGVGRQLTMAAVRQQAAEKGISVAAALAQAKEDGYVIKP